MFTNGDKPDEGKWTQEVKKFTGWAGWEALGSQIITGDAYDLCLERCTDLAGIQLCPCQRKQHNLSCTCYKNPEITMGAEGYG